MITIYVACNLLLMQLYCSDFFVNKQQYKIDIYLSIYISLLFNHSHSRSVMKETPLHTEIIKDCETYLSHKKLIIFPKLKHKIDKYVKYVNIVIRVFP